MTTLALKTAADASSDEAFDEREARALLLESFIHRIIAQRGKVDIGADDMRMFDIAEGALLCVTKDSGKTPSDQRSVLMLNPIEATKPEPQPGDGGTADLVGAELPTPPVEAIPFRLPKAKPATVFGDGAFAGHSAAGMVVADQQPALS